MEACFSLQVQILNNVISKIQGCKSGDFYLSPLGFAHLTLNDVCCVRSATMYKAGGFGRLMADIVTSTSAPGAYKKVLAFKSK